MSSDREFEIALSFAGEDREYVDQVANLLRESGVSVFYDIFEEANLWGKNLYDYLTEIYSEKAAYTIMFISEHYAKKLWTDHERQAMQARAFQEKQEYILPARFDETRIPGIRPTTGYISLRERTPQEFVAIIEKKLINSGRTVPSLGVRRSLSALRYVPKVEPTVSTVTLTSSDGEPVANADIVAVADNGTTVSAATDRAGVGKVSIGTKRQYDLLVAHNSHHATIFRSWNPTEDLTGVLVGSENVGSQIICGIGYIPGLSGRLNPVLDDLNRTYLYADNIAINGGGAQPGYFSIDQPFELEDANGVVVQVQVVYMKGKITLLQYVSATSGDSMT